MTNQMIKAKATDIEGMNENELEEFGTIVDMSFLDGNSKMELYRAIEAREQKLREMKEMAGAGVVIGEIREGEL